MIKVSLNGTVAGIRTLGETNCLGINIHSQELPIEKQADLLRIKHLYCEIELKADDLLSDITEIIIDKKAGQKSDSEEQRDCLYILWKMEESQEDFNSYYHKKMLRNKKFILDEVEKIKAKKSGFTA